MRGFRLFEKPLGVGDSLPPLSLVGVLPDYETGAPYEGRVNIINGVGRCSVELLENNLPPGASVFVDNFNKQVVIKWPAYSPPTTEATTIVNGDFQERDLFGWRDVRGNSWSVKESTELGTAWATPGDYVAVMEGVGRGDHVLESELYPATPGEMVYARSLWDQGPSNKDNNNLWTAIQFYDRFKNPFTPDPWYEWYGDRIHDRTNKSRHHSTVEVRTPPNAAFKTVRLIAHRRNGRNRWIAVDNVETRGFNYEVGAGGMDDFHLTIRVTDSANRKALWSGILWNKSFWLAGNVYPQYHGDSAAISPMFFGAGSQEGVVFGDSGVDSTYMSPLFFEAASRSTYSTTDVTDNVSMLPLFFLAGSRAVIQTHSQPVENLAISPLFFSGSTENVLTPLPLPVENLAISPLFFGASST